MPNNQLNITNIPSSRVDFIDQRTGLMSREWYRFFLNLFALTGNGGNQTSLDDLQLAPPAAQSLGSVTSINVSGGSTGLTATGGPITSSGTITLGGTLGIPSGGTGATTATTAFNALSPITTAGDLIIGDGTNSATRLGIGANGLVLTSNGTTATWAAGGGSSGGPAIYAFAAAHG
jgi:hypothetical protein